MFRVRVNTQKIGSRVPFDETEVKNPGFCTLVIAEEIATCVNDTRGVVCNFQTITFEAPPAISGIT